MSVTSLGTLGWWRNTSIRTKMQSSIFGFALLVLLISAITLNVVGNLYFHAKMKHDLMMLSNILAENSGAALTFNDADSARKVLAALKENATIVAAGLYQHGQEDVFAEYPDKTSVMGLQAKSRDSGVWLEDNFYITSVPVKVNGQAVGQLVLKSNLSDLQLFKEYLLKLFTALFVVLILLTLLVSYWLKTHITHPLAALSEWAMQITRHKDFSARAQKKNDDEIGHLVDSLNNMLGELSKQETIVSLNQELAREIQERKLIESDLIAMRNRAEEANKAKSRFLANMSHELRTPLNAIIGYSEMLQEIVTEDEFEVNEIVQDIGKVRAAGKHLLSLINDILDISKIEAGKMQIDIEAFSMHDLVQDVVDTLKPLLEEKQNKFVVSGQNAVGILHSDMVKVRQILFNLLSNAIKFTQHGEVTLTCSLEITGNESWLVCQVKDTGIGIDDVSLKELFKPFNQADPSTTRKFGGTGLGLAISRSYLTMLGGEISATSEVGKGSEFTFRLPTKSYLSDIVESDTAFDTRAGAPQTVKLQNDNLANQRNIPAHKVDSGLSPVGNAQEHGRQHLIESDTNLLLIDDDKAVHDRLRYKLGKHGFIVHSAMSGEDGLAMALQQRFDVIVLDIFMPGIDGWQVLQRLKSNQATSEVPVVMYSIEKDEARGFALGASDYLVKPINGQRLLGILQRYKKPHKRLKVLSIDDDKHSQELVQAYLDGQDWEVTLADNGREGLKQLQAHPDFAVILLDLIMPEMNGFEFLENCHQTAIAADIPIIVISARDLTQQERKLLVQHTRTVIRKGMYDRNTLLRSIQKVLDEQIPVDQQGGTP